MEAKRSTSTASTKRIFSIKELATEFGGTVWFWRSQIWDGQLKYIQIGKKMFLDRYDVEEFIEKHKRQN